MFTYLMYTTTTTEILNKQAGDELCQAQAQVDLPAEAEFTLKVGC